MVLQIEQDSASSRRRTARGHKVRFLGFQLTVKKSLFVRWMDKKEYSLSVVFYVKVINLPLMGLTKDLLFCFVLFCFALLCFALLFWFGLFACLFV